MLLEHASLNHGWTSILSADSHALCTGPLLLSHPISPFLSSSGTAAPAPPHFIHLEEGGILL